MPRTPIESWSTREMCWLLSVFDSDGGELAIVLKELCVPTHSASVHGSASPRRCCSSSACVSHGSWAAGEPVIAFMLVAVLSAKTHTNPEGFGAAPGGHGGSPDAPCAATGTHMSAINAPTTIPLISSHFGKFGWESCPRSRLRWYT